MSHLLATLLVVVSGGFVAGQAEDFRCPSDTGTYPDTADNTRFFECVSGEVVVHNCIASHVFSREAKGCVQANTSKVTVGGITANTTLSQPSPTMSREETDVVADNVHVPQTFTTTTSDNSDISLSSESNDTDVVTTRSDQSTSTVRVNTDPNPSSTVRVNTDPNPTSTVRVNTNDTGNSSNSPSKSGVGLTGVPANSTDQSQTGSEVTGMPTKSTGQQAERGQQVTIARAVVYQASLEELLAEGRARYALSDDTDEEAKVEEAKVEEVKVEEVKIEEEFLCPNESGFFRHPTNCSRFYWCNQFIPTAMFCAPDTAFDPETHVCSWAVGPEGCGAQLPFPRHTHDPHRQHATVLTTTQPADLSETQGEGRQVRSGRQPRQAYQGQYNSRDRATSTTDDGDSKKSAGKSFGLDSRGVDFNAGRDNFQCPGDGFYADPQDCSYFYHCSIGKAYKFKCQNGTAFNRDKFVCSWPVGEDGCGGMLSVPYRQVLEEELGLSTNHVNSNFRCPQPEGFYPDPENCSIFYHCVKSKPYYHECGSGTLFSATKGLCVWSDSDDNDDGGKKCGDSSMLGESYRAALDNDQPRDQQEGADIQKKAPVAPRDKDDHHTVKSDHHAVEEEEEEEEEGDMLHHDHHHSHSEFSEESRNVESDKYNQQPERKEQTVEPETTPTEARSGPTGVSTRSALDGMTLKAQSVPDGMTLKAQPVPDGMKLKAQPVTDGMTLKAQPVPDGMKLKAQPVTDGMTLKAQPVPDGMTLKAQPVTDGMTLKAQPVPDGMTLKAQPVHDFSQVASSWPWGNTDKKVAANSQEASTDMMLRVSTGATNGASTTFAAATTSTPQHAPSTTDSTSTPAPSHKTTLRAEVYRVIGLETDFRCPQPAGHFRDPRNCAVYYHCADGVAYRLDCPDGQLYDVRQYQCLPIAQVKDCVRVDKDQVDDWEERWLGTYPEVDSYPKQKDFLESFECEESSGFHSNPHDCSSYIECIDGVPYARKCISGTVFDEGRKKCTWSSLVPACNTGSRAPDELRTEGYDCPSSDGYYRNPRDCSTFYHCIDGTALLGKCDVNLYFDPQTSTCRWSLAVRDCDRDGRPVFLDKLPMSSFACPLPNGHFRDPADCSAFYHCLHDLPYRGQCGAANAFDLDSLACKPRSEVADCGEDSATTGQPAAPDMSQTTIGERKMTDERKGESSDENLLMSDDDNNTPPPKGSSFRCPKAHGLYRDPGDCGFFFHCFAGRSFRHACEQGTVFSAHNNLCTWPALVPECRTATSHLASLTSAPSQTTSWEARDESSPVMTSAQQQTTGEEGGRKAEEVAYTVEKTEKQLQVQVVPSDLKDFDYDLAESHVGEVSSDGVDDFVLEAPAPESKKSEAVVDDAYTNFVCPPIIMDQYYRDPVDCTHFHRCVKGTRFSFVCPRGTFFEPVLGVCDFHDKVPDCGADGVRLSVENLSNGDYTPVVFPGVFPLVRGQSVGESSTGMAKGSSESEDRLCPRLDGMFPHPASCRKFVYCSRGAAVVLTCPTDLLYNSKAMTCDYKDSIECSSHDK